MSKSKNRRLSATKQAHKPTPKPVQSETEKLEELAEKIFLQKGGDSLQRLLRTMLKTLSLYERQLDQINAGEEIKLLVTPFVALRYMKEVERIEDKMQALKEEALAQAIAETAQKPEPARIPEPSPQPKTIEVGPASVPQAVKTNTPQAPPASSEQQTTQPTTA